MSVRAIVTLGLALMFGISAAVLIRQAMFPQMKAAQQNQETVDVVVAAAKFGRGKLLSKDLLTTRPVPKDAVPQGVFLASQIQDLYGQVARMDVEAGEHIFTSKVVDRLSLVPEISPGKLAFTISTPSATSSNAGLLQPEDRVNVIFSPSGNRAGSASVTLLKRMRIIAINREYLQRSPEDKREFAQVQSVTLDVTQEQSELLSWSQSRGTLSLALLSHDGEPERHDVESTHELTLAELQRILGLQTPSKQVPVETASGNSTSGVRLLVPARAINAGEHISAESLMEEVYAADKVPEGALRAADLEEVLGKQPLVALVRGEPLFAARFSQRRGSISDFVPAGKRAYRITSNAGRLVADDRVDVVFAPREAGNTNRPEAITLMSGIRVILVNDKPQGTNKSIEAYEAATTVMLELTPQEVELLSWAERRGTLRLAVVSSMEDTAGLSTMTLAELRQLIDGKPEKLLPLDSAAVELTSVVLPASAAATVVINELRNRALGQTQLKLYP